MRVIRSGWMALAGGLILLGCGGGADDTAGHQTAGSAPARVAPSNPGTTPAQPSGGAMQLAGITFAPASEWQDLGSSTMRKAQYQLAPVEGDADVAELNVFYFGQSQGGDIEANIARWIGQMSAPDGGDASKVAVRSKLTTSNGLTLHFVEVDGTYNKSMGGGPMTGGRTKALSGYRMVAAIIEAPQGNVFFKLTGPTETAKAMEEGMRSMLGGAHKI